MRFSPEGYYVERYVKCANCGLLIYDQGVSAGGDRKGLFCSSWCVDWDAQRQAGVDHPVLKLPTP
jgi:N-methylhydantoinase B